MKYIDKLLDVNNVNRTVFQIIFWWELRRILYNIVALIGGIVSLSIMSIIVNVPNGEDLVEPFAIIGFGILCNIGYSLVWIIEVFIKRNILFAPRTFKIGTFITLLFIFLPLVIHVFLWIFRGFKTMY